MTQDINTRIGDIINSKDVILFMKGTPLFPQCGFSSKAIAILEHLGVSYDSIDVLQDHEVRCCLPMHQPGRIRLRWSAKARLPN